MTRKLGGADKDCHGADVEQWKQCPHEEGITESIRKLQEDNVASKLQNGPKTPAPTAEDKKPDRSHSGNANQA